MSVWNLPENHTIGQYIAAVLAIRTKEDMAEFYRENVAFVQRQIDSGKWESHYTAEQAAQANIGWCFGEE